MSTNPPATEATPMRKFMFDQSFDQIAANLRAQDANKPVTLKPNQIEQIKREAYDSGFAAGKQAAQEEGLARQTTMLGQIEEQLTRLFHHVDHAQHEQEGELRRVIIAIARKFLPGYLAKHGMDEIQAMLDNVIGEMRHEPRLVVRVQENELEALTAKINEIAAQKAYSGKVVVLADADIGEGDCRIEWADGGAERKTANLWKTIEDILTPSSDHH